MTTKESENTKLLSKRKFDESKLMDDFYRQYKQQCEQMSFSGFLLFLERELLEIISQKCASNTEICVAKVKTLIKLIEEWI